MVKIPMANNVYKQSNHVLKLPFMTIEIYIW